MDDFEDRYREAIEAGQRNVRAVQLLENWCFHAEFVRSPGRGLIEAETGLPIGHMGVQCKFSKKNSMFCWLLEDAAYDFYQNNCKACDERLPIGLPNIMSFVGPREEAAERRRKERSNLEAERKERQAERRQERAELRNELSLEESFVLDLLDELDQDAIAKDDSRLEQLANLAPETFTRKVIKHLLPAVLQEYLPYSIPAARALLTASLRPEEKLAVAVRLVVGYERSSTAIKVVLSNAEALSQLDLAKVIRRFVSMALGPPPGMRIGGGTAIQLDSGPVQQLFQKRRSDIVAFVDAGLSSADPQMIGAAIETVLAVDRDELLSKNVRSIVVKLMRRRTLLAGVRRDSDLLYYLREGASNCLEVFPEETDVVIQSYLAESDNIGTAEANGIYRSVLKHRYREKIRIGPAQRIAFRRLLWAAVESPEDGMDEAGQFFKNSWDEFSALATEHFDDLIGAAATLTKKYEQVDSGSSLELAKDVLAHMEKRNKLTAIDSLQVALIEWAALAARSKGRKGIEEYLELYRGMPVDQTQMRANMIVHVSKLLSGVESLTLVLSDWYRALMDESTLVRACAVQAWENVPYNLVKNFPDLFFDAFAVSLSDPYVIVHRSAVHALRRRSFPKEKRDLVKNRLWNQILYYSQENKEEDFIVDCIDAFAFLCVSREKREGKIGQLLTSILLTLEGSALYRAVDRLHYGFASVPGFAKVALKSIQDRYTRSISINDCTSVILNASRDELQSCVEEIKTAFAALRPFRREGFYEALLYGAALTKAGEYGVARDCFTELVESISTEDRNAKWRLEAALVSAASEIEHAITSGVALTELVETWNRILSDLENENAERAKLRDFPTNIFMQD